MQNGWPARRSRGQRLCQHGEVSRSVRYDMSMICPCGKVVPNLSQESNMRPIAKFSGKSPASLEKRAVFM